MGEAVDYSNQARDFIEQKRYEEALKAVNESLRLDPLSVCAYCYKGAILHYLNCYEEALKSYDEALRLDVQGTDGFYIHFCRGVILRHLGLYKEAIASYDKV